MANSPEKEAGFDCEFVEPPPDVLQIMCPVCLLIIRDPYQVTCCGKRFCQYCIKAASSPCPTCKADSVHTFPDKGLKQSLYSLRVHCSQKENGCEWTGEVGQLEAHLNKDPQPGRELCGCPHAIINCEFHHVGCTVKLTRKTIPTHLKEDLHTHMSMMVVGHCKLGTECKALREACERLECENKQLKSEVAALQNQGANVHTEARRMIMISPSDVLVMTNFQQHKRDGNWWYSPPVYTHHQGYKICLGVCASGYGNSTHVSVFVYFLRGEFDDLLTWPFRGAIKFQLLDQTGSNHKTHLCTYDDSVELKNCERVRYGERANSGWGAPALIAHSALKQKYLPRDSLWFQIISGEAHV